MGSVLNLILLPLCMVQIKRIRRQQKSTIPNTNVGKLLCRPSTSYKKLFAFGIIYVALAKSWSARGASQQPAFMGSCLTNNHTRLGCLLSRGVSPECSIKSYRIESHMEFCQTSTTELLFEYMWSAFR